MNTGTDGEPSACELMAHVSRLFVYPIKSCAGIEVPHARLLPTGLQWDRSWMLVDASGKFVTQRECPRMALIHPRFTPTRLYITAPDMPEPTTPSRKPGIQERVVRVWDDQLIAHDAGDGAAQWFSQYLQKTVRLVREGTVMHKIV